MVDVVEEALDVDFEHPSAADPRRRLPHRLQRVVCTTSRPKAVRAWMEILLVDGFE